MKRNKFLQLNSLVAMTVMLKMLKNYFMFQQKKLEVIPLI
jgi:hypothetical protein